MGTRYASGERHMLSLDPIARRQTAPTGRRRAPTRPRAGLPFRVGSRAS